MSKWSPEVLEVLEASGWTAGRRVDTTGWRSRFVAVGIVGRERSGRHGAGTGRGRQGVADFLQARGLLRATGDLTAPLGAPSRMG